MSTAIALSTSARRPIARAIGSAVSRVRRAGELVSATCVGSPTASRRARDLASASVAPFRLLDAALAVIPWDDEVSRLLGRDAARSAGHIHLSRWLTEVESVWATHGKRSNEPLVPRLDYFGQLSAQMPPPPIRVVYGASGTLPAAAVLRDPSAVVEHKLYWAAVASEEEGIARLRGPL